MGLTELITSTLRQIRLIDIVDIGVVAYVVYRALLLIRGTRAMAIINGIVLILVLIWISSPLATFNWLLRNLMLPSVIAVVVIFQPELRMALERIGRAGFLGRTLSDLHAEQRQSVIAEIVDAATDFSRRRIGALIVLERRT
ncbi:MAG: TIGR00159 family protein, partial [Armatimonadetes bacterium]|nr:TIGR00159 family protein [Armatimonadota bacterium]